jgi:hypothetical protein
MPLLFSIISAMLIIDIAFISHCRRFRHFSSPPPPPPPRLSLAFERSDTAIRRLIIFIDIFFFRYHHAISYFLSLSFIIRRR